MEMAIKDYLDEVEAVSHAGECVVCFHELVDPVPPSVADPIYLHAAFYAINCRLWWLCVDCIGRIHPSWRKPNADCTC